jgi:glycosyltransferase involved in cell wall biosynthesis
MMAGIRPLKVLYVLHDSRRSGVPAVAAAFIRQAGQAGVTPTVLFAHDGVYADDLKREGIPVVTMGARTPFLWRSKRFLLNLFLLGRGKEFDVIHIHSIKLVWTVLFAKRLGLKVVFHLHELPRKISGSLRSAMAVADQIVFCSETCAAHFVGIPVRAKRTIVNAMAFTNSPPVIHCQAGRLKIVMAASLNKNKGQDILLKAFARLQNRDAELWLYGTTGLSAHGYVCSLKKFAAEHGITDRVFFPGPTVDVMAVFAETAVMVHTSWTESFGMALVEAQSCGVPVIAHDLEGMREVVEDGVTGYLIEPGNVAELTGRLDELLSDYALRERMGGAGYRSVRKRFAIGSRVPEFIELYQHMI